MPPTRTNVLVRALVFAVGFGVWITGILDLDGGQTTAGWVEITLGAAAMVVVLNLTFGRRRLP